MVLAHHLIFTAHGFWLPNDPRGSWSDFVRNWELLRFGTATKTNTRQSVANQAHDRNRRLMAKQFLKHSAVLFTGEQALLISKGIKKAILESGYTVLACSILPDHVHLVILRHDYSAERMMGHLKARATQALLAAGLHPFAEQKYRNGRIPEMFAHKGWKVFLDSIEDIERAIEYVEGNPMKEGLPKQDWGFVYSLSSKRVQAALRKRSR